MATSWLIMLIPYFVPIIVLAVLHIMDRRHGFARPASVVKQDGARALKANGRRRQVV
jgi:hypothetical protein